MLLKSSLKLGAALLAITIGASIPPPTLASPNAGSAPRITGAFGGECYENRYGKLNGVQQLLPDCNLIPYSNPFVNIGKSWTFGGTTYPAESWRKRPLFTDTSQGYGTCHSISTSACKGDQFYRSSGSSEIDFYPSGTNDGCTLAKTNLGVTGFNQWIARSGRNSSYFKYGVRCTRFEAPISLVRPGWVVACETDKVGAGKRIPMKWYAPKGNGNPDAAQYSSKFVVRVDQSATKLFPYRSAGDNPRFSGKNVTQYDVYVHVNDKKLANGDSLCATMLSEDAKPGASSRPAGTVFALLSNQGAEGVHLHLETWACNFTVGYSKIVVESGTLGKMNRYRRLTSQDKSPSGTKECVWARPYWRDFENPSVMRNTPELADKD